MAIELTDEQKKIVEEAKKGGVIIVNAFAGTGKTTTCLAVAEQSAKDKKKTLYLAFNNSVSKEIARKTKKMEGFDKEFFEVKTVHGLAYKELARTGYFKNREIANVKVKDVSYLLDVSYQEAFWILEFFNFFLYSAYDFTSIDKFVSETVKKSRRFRLGFEILSKNSIDLPKVLENLVNAIREKRMPLTHDFYLKDYLFNYLDKSKTAYDTVILDESQDANPLFIKLLKLLKPQTLLLVGDRHQRIYQFRNTVEAYNFFTKKKLLYLTQTFRFGGNISSLANNVLSLKGETETIKPAPVPKKVEKENAVISFTNSELLSYYLHASKSERKFFTFERDIETIIKPVMTILFMEERDINDDYIDIPSKLLDYSILNSFTTYEQLESYVEKLIEMHEENKYDDDISFTSDRELITAYFLSQKLTYKKLLDILDDYESNKREKKTTYLSTAHSVKGLEYNKVLLLSDLADSIEKMKDITTSLNLLYVAITRATHEVDTSLVNKIISKLKGEDKEELKCT